MAARPAYPLAVANTQQQFEVFGEQRVVIGEIETEQREGFDERAAPGHDFGPAVRDKVERRKALENAHGIIGGKHRDGAGQAYGLGARGGSRQHDVRRRDQIVGPVVFAQAEDVETDLIGQFDLLDEIADPLDRIEPHAGRRVGHIVAEGVDAEFHSGRLSE